MEISVQVNVRVYVCVNGVIVDFNPNQYLWSAVCP